MAHVETEYVLVFGQICCHKLDLNNDERLSKLTK